LKTSFAQNVPIDSHGANQTGSKKLLDALIGTPKLMAAILYGTGMRAMELLRLRVKDLDFDQGIITIREGKGDKDRITMMPATCIEPSSPLI